MTSEQIKQLDSEYVAQTYGRFDLALAKGKGCDVWDPEGNHYLDFESGIGTLSLGWADDEWAAAVAAQAGTLQHTSNLYYTQPYAQLAQALCEKSGMKRAFFSNSGAESNEGAIKAARKYSHDKYGDGRSVVLTLENSFHGRTVTTLAATGQEVFHQHFFPFTGGFEHLPANDAAALEARLNAGGVCALMLEVVQGEGGILPLNTEYLLAAQKLCETHDVLLVIDEVQTGIGRTGKLFAHQHMGLQPDIVTLAKGLGGGLPIGAVLLGEKGQSTLGKGDHAATYGGNPVCCAGANVVLNRLDNAFLAEVARKGEKLWQGLAALPRVKAVSGLGLMLGLEFEDGIAAGDVVKACMQKGMLPITAKHKLRLLPPLVITDEQIETGLTILKQVLEEI